MGDHLVRIGSRLFNLAHVTSIEPGEGGCAMDFHLVHGRVVRLEGDDARAARALVESYPPSPPSPGEGGPRPGGGDLPFEVADDPGEEPGPRNGQEPKQLRP